MSEGVLPIAAALQTSDSFQLSEYSALASFILILWDAFITTGDEVTYIWPKPRGAYIKWLYLFGKYFVLASQTGISFFQISVIARKPLSNLGCHIYRGIQVAEIHLLLVVFDIVLFLRIYALHGRNKLVKLLGTLAISVECITAVVGNVLVFPKLVYDPACMAITFPKVIVVVIAGTLVSQTALLWLAYRKKETVARAEQGMTSIASGTIRDGGVAFICISALFLILLGAQLSDSSIMNMTIFWFPVCVSIATCRIIMNLQRVSHREVSQELTTEIWRSEYELESCPRAS